MTSGLEMGKEGGITVAEAESWPGGTDAQVAQAARSRPLSSGCRVEERRGRLQE